MQTIKTTKATRAAHERLKASGHRATLQDCLRAYWRHCKGKRRITNLTPELQTQLIINYIQLNH